MSVVVVLAALLGGLVGLTLALTGAGGGILAVPLLVFGLHLSLAQAAPVGLVAVGMAAALGAVLANRLGKVRQRAALAIGGAGMLVAPLGVWLAQRVPNTPLLLLFAAVMLLSARSMFQRSQMTPEHVAALRAAHPPPCRCDASSGRFIWTRPCTRVMLLTGATSGLLTGLLGVGGGFVIVPLLTRYSDLSADCIIATSLAVIALVSTSSVAAAALHGAMPWAMALPFATGAALAHVVGRHFAARLSGARLQLGFAWLSVGVAGLLIARSAAAAWG